MDLRRLTLLHSNDLHGDFFATETHDRMVGGMSRLSGYVNRVREESEDPVLYALAGDMLQGSIIDQEYKGISTILVMNMLGPDIATIGNHELDYGFAHLMFLEKCANFPIVNANLYIKPTETNLFKPYSIMEVEGIRILFIGIITDEIIAISKSEPLIGSFIGVQDAAQEIEYICNNYKDIDIDLTVLLTHIGLDKDIELAQLLPPEIGVDVIIGAHSHTMMEQPEEVNDILIAQVGWGTEHIGRFDLTIDMDNNQIHDYRWEAVPIDDSHCPHDPVMDELLEGFQTAVDGKYNTVLCRLPHALEHGSRFRETELGNLFADIIGFQLGVDIALVASGSIRKERLDQLVTRASLMETYPYDEPIMGFTVTGRQLELMLQNLMHALYHEGAREFYQWNENLRIEVLATGDIASITIYGQALNPQAEYRVGMQSYHYGILESTFGISSEEVASSGRVRVISTSSQDLIIEYLKTQKLPRKLLDGRIQLTEPLIER